MKLNELAAFVREVGQEAAEDMLMNMGAVSSYPLAKALIAKAQKTGKAKQGKQG